MESTQSGTEKAATGRPTDTQSKSVQQKSKYALPPRQQRSRPAKPQKSVEQIMSELFGGEPEEEKEVPLSTFESLRSEKPAHVSQETPPRSTVQRTSVLFDTETVKKPARTQTRLPKKEPVKGYHTPRTENIQATAIGQSSSSSASVVNDIHAGTWEKEKYSWESDAKARTTASIRDVRAMKRADWQRAIILKEILSPPVSMRKDHLGL